VAPAVLRALVNGSKTNIALPERVPRAAQLALPWYTLVEVVAGAETATFFAGPAKVRAGVWSLPALAENADLTSIEGRTG